METELRLSLVNVCQDGDPDFVKLVEKFVNVD